MRLWEFLPGRYRVTSDPLRTERRIELAVVLLAVVLGLQLLYSGARVKMLSLPEAVMPARDALLVGDLYPMDRITPEQSEELLARPLFWEGRRALVAQNQSASRKQGRGVGQLKDIKLQGVFGAGETAGVIIKLKDQQRRVMVGEEINGWTLESVDTNEVVLSSGGRQESLQLRKGTVAAKATVPVARKDASPTSRAAEKTRSQPSATPGASGSESKGEAELSFGGSVRR